MIHAQPDFFILGAMKCATSTLHDQLSALGCFHMSNPKEPNFFSDDVNFARGESWYRSLFAGARPGMLRGESSTHYTKLPDLPKSLPRLRAMMGEDVRFIYVMRHPIDRMISHYIHAWTDNRIRAPIDDAPRLLPEVVSYGLYAKQLRGWLEVYGANRIFPIFFDSLVSRPQLELERICDFLGAPTPIWKEDRVASNVSAKRLRASPVRDALLDIPFLRSLRRNFVPQSVRDMIKSLWMIRYRPELSVSVRDDLELCFDSDLAQLGDWLGIELSCSSFHERAMGSPPLWTGAVPGESK